MSQKRQNISQEKHCKKRLCVFKDIWLNDTMCNQWLNKVGSDTAYCKLCKTNITVKYEGFLAIKKHSQRNEHLNNVKLGKVNNAINNFLITKNSTEEENVTIAEVSFVYHSIRHHHSYLSSECGMKLVHKLFPDSNICKKVHCARTKSEAIAEYVLSPFSIENHLQNLSDKKFSIATDASNKGNIKLFPVCIQYFSISEGIKNFVIDFYEDSNESSFNIYSNIKKIMISHNLKFENIISYAADNASVNYGIHNSVFKNFNSENRFIVKANCNCHVLHNAAKYGLMKLPLDIENLVIKIYNHFSVSSKRFETLKTVYEFTETNYLTLLKHVPTRWLTLYKAIDRLITNLEPIKLYFCGVDLGDCPLVISEFIWEESSNNKMSLSELFLHFSHQFMKIFYDTILLLEKTSTNSTHLYHIMDQLRGKLKNRIENNFFGSICNENIHSLSSENKKTFKKAALSCYKRTIEYLEKWFNYDNSIFKLFSCLNLDDKIKYDKVIQIVKLLNIDVNNDILFDECSLFNEVYSHLNNDDKKDNAQILCKILQSNEMPNLTKIIETVLSIPIGNDFVERVFSLMQSIWTDDRNKMRVNLVKSEICTIVNFSMTCSEFSDHIRKNKELIKAAKSEKSTHFLKRHCNTCY
jgi:hypothetical protein